MANIVADLLPAAVSAVLPSAARTATPTDTNEYQLGRARGLTVVVDVTAIVSAPSITVTIQGIDRVSGKTWTILASAAITTVSTVIMRVAPGLPVVANVTANDLVPPLVRIVATHGNANSITYSVAALVSA